MPTKDFSHYYLLKAEAFSLSADYTTKLKHGAKAPNDYPGRDCSGTLLPTAPRFTCPDKGDERSPLCGVTKTHGRFKLLNGKIKKDS
jgi:hypothetical protein